MQHAGLAACIAAAGLPADARAPRIIVHQVDELNRIFDEVEESDSPSLGGAGHMGGDALHWGKAYRDLLDMPQISPILEELVGNHVSGFTRNPPFAGEFRVHFESVCLRFTGLS